VKNYNFITAQCWKGIAAGYGFFKYLTARSHNAKIRHHRRRNKSIPLDSILSHFIVLLIPRNYFCWSPRI